MSTTVAQQEQRIVLKNVSWQLYEHLLETHRDRSTPRFIYNQGELEIVSPSAKHEQLKDLIVLVVNALAEAREMDVVGLGSTTFSREDLERGFEPDGCFYLTNIERVKGKAEIDLTSDPPPDIVVEIDVTSPSIKKLPIFAALGVAEVWHYEDTSERWRILRLAGDAYTEETESRYFPKLTAATLAQFSRDNEQMARPAWLRSVRAWATETA
jgi:Uma2 family endonuclease